VIAKGGNGIMQNTASSARTYANGDCTVKLAPCADELLSSLIADMPHSM